MTDEKIERGAAEEESGSPLTPTEAEASRSAPTRSDSGSGPGGRHLEEHGKADSAKDTDV